MDLYNPNVVSQTEMVRDRLYFAVLKSNTKLPNNNVIYLNTDDEFVYVNYYNDFGPLHISCLYKYCYKMSNILHRNPSKRIVHYTTTKYDKKANAAFLIGSFVIIYFKVNPRDVSKSLNSTCTDIRPFHDASQGNSDWNLTVYDCFFAMHKAQRLGFFHLDDFNDFEYDTYGQIQNGDLNWLLPNKFLAFIGPSDYQLNYCHPPEFYIQYFVTHDVQTVIRLNNDLYDKSAFEAVGIAHYDLCFPDGSTPPKEILMAFFKICENREGAIAVHCKAGLGRTGTLIGAYLVKHYRLRARETIAWLRICRPGCVIGPQQSWLENLEAWLWNQGNQFRLEYYGDSEKCLYHRYGINSRKWSIIHEHLMRKNRQIELQRNYVSSAMNSAQSKYPNYENVQAKKTSGNGIRWQSAKNPSNPSRLQNSFNPIHMTQGDKLNSIKAYRNRANSYKLPTRHY